MSYDVIIVGAGAGGGVAAGVLAEAGKRVLLLERGRKLEYQDIPRDHLRNHRNERYGNNTDRDKDGNPRVVIDLYGNQRIVKPHEGGYQNNAMTVGGGTRVYGAQAWRFLPQDFRMASIYGVPEGSSLADWPISYADLAPYYERAEWEVGVAGDSAKSAALWERERDFPMPPVSDGAQAKVLRRGGEKLGMNVMNVPLLINTTPYLGRPACTQCQHCVGFACPVDAKNGSQNTLIARALASGNCDLVTEAVVEQLDVDSTGRVIGVSYYDYEGQRHSVRADVVVVAGGAIETARLLLNSKSKHHPNGIGNQYDQVGRNLQGHYYPAAYGEMEDVVYDGQGPGVSVASCDFNHGNDGIIGGSMIADEFVVLPIIFWNRNLPPELPRWGAANKQYMRENFRHVMRVTGPVQEIPSADARVRVDPHVRDRWGIPVAQLSGTTHPETVRTAQFMLEQSKRWLAASGARRVWGNPPGLSLSGGQHQAGTCRMGDDPQSSVVDAHCRVHGHDNLFIADGAVHTTNGGFNPVLTIMALAFRTAEHIAKH